MLQSLQGNGEDGYKAERAFYHYMGDVQKTKDHLAAAKQVSIFMFIARDLFPFLNSLTKPKVTNIYKKEFNI